MLRSQPSISRRCRILCCNPGKVKGSCAALPSGQCASGGVKGACPVGPPCCRYREQRLAKVQAERKRREEQRLKNQLQRQQQAEQKEQERLKQRAAFHQRKQSE